MLQRLNGVSIRADGAVIVDPRDPKNFTENGLLIIPARQEENSRPAH
jgi:hypothetical protein